jgi:hypothetical protein
MTHDAVAFARIGPHSASFTDPWRKRTHLAFYGMSVRLYQSDAASFSENVLTGSITQKSLIVVRENFFFTLLYKVAY